MCNTVNFVYNYSTGIYCNFQVYNYNYICIIQSTLQLYMYNTVNFTCKYRNTLYVFYKYIITIIYPYLELQLRLSGARFVEDSRRETQFTNRRGYVLRSQQISTVLDLGPGS